jgi:hypothetical protein
MCRDDPPGTAACHTKAALRSLMIFLIHLNAMVGVGDHRLYMSPLAYIRVATQIGDHLRRNRIKSAASATPRPTIPARKLTANSPLRTITYQAIRFRSVTLYCQCANLTTIIGRRLVGYNRLTWPRQKFGRSLYTLFTFLRPDTASVGSRSRQRKDRAWLSSKEIKSV